MPQTQSQMTAESVMKTVSAFEAMSITPIYAARCCGRVYVGRDPAARCRTCDRSPDNISIENLEDLKKTKLQKLGLL